MEKKKKENKLSVGATVRYEVSTLRDLISRKHLEAHETLKPTFQLSKAKI